MKNLLKVTGITIALTAIGVAMRAKDNNKKISRGTIDARKTRLINLDLADLDSAPSLERPRRQI